MPNKHLKNDKTSPKLPDYYRKTYQPWYKWFSYIYDPFIKLFCFIFNGGFGGERRWRQLIVEGIDPRPGEKIVDICCGTGTLSIMLAEKLAGTGEVVGIDLSSRLLDLARKKQKPGGVTFLEGDAQKIPFSHGHFHKGVICGALHEMPREVRRKVLAEAHRVIKPNGRIVVVEHNNPKRRWKRSLFAFLERFNPEYPTYRDLLKCGLTDEIERGGFRVVRTSVTNWEFFQIVLAER
jgi:demethylmenaquinone methyltransferase/2-methoxy-6-polyprenyl-1,4-benzoquinol methylase